MRNQFHDEARAGLKIDGPRFRICGSTSGIQRLGETFAASLEKATKIFLISNCIGDGSWSFRLFAQCLTYGV
jgi:hypothetical protein